MSPNPPYARKKLSYPLYGADFDPLNHDFLIVGGGGGSTSSGVPNKISLLDASRFTELNEIVDLELPKDEDSVTSLAVANSDSTSITAYAGINGSIKSQEGGKNEHFRSFSIGLPARKRKVDENEKTTPNIPSSASLPSKALGRTALFKSATGPKNETYQRVLRVSSNDEGDEKIAAIASGLAPQNEVVSFRVSTSPNQSDIISRINLETKEAADLDIATVVNGARSHVLAYCTDYQVFLQPITSTQKDVKEPVEVYNVTQTEPGTKIRALRWLNSRHLVLLKNRVGRTGAEVAILKTDQDYSAAKLVLVKRLTRSTKQAVGLDVCKLSKSATGDQQFVVGIAGQDSSIEILTVNHYQKGGMDKFRQYTHLTEVHSGPITRITFSRFKHPSVPVTKDTKPQYIRLATVGVDQTVMVFTLPMRPFPASSKTPAYVLTAPAEAVQNTINISIALLVVALTAFFMQIFCEVRGAVPPYLNATSWLSPAWQERIARPYLFPETPVIPESMPPVIQTATSSLSSAVESTTDIVKSAVDAAVESGESMLHELVNVAGTSNKAIVIRDFLDSNSPDAPQELTTELHDHDSDHVKSETLKKWDQMTHEEKQGWKQKLKSAGHWTEKQGETVLKGILFSQLGGLVGAAMHG